MVTGRAGIFAIHPTVFQNPFSRAFHAHASTDVVFLSINHVVPEMTVFPTKFADFEATFPAVHTTTSVAFLAAHMNPCTHFVDALKKSCIFSPAYPRNLDAVCIPELFSVALIGFVSV